MSGMNSFGALADFVKLLGDRFAKFATGSFEIDIFEFLIVFGATSFFAIIICNGASANLYAVRIYKKTKILDGLSMLGIA